MPGPIAAQVGILTTLGASVRVTAGSIYSITQLFTEHALGTWPQQAICHIITNPSVTLLLIGFSPFYRQDTEGPRESCLAKTTECWVGVVSQRWPGEEIPGKKHYPATAWRDSRTCPGNDGTSQPPAQHHLCPSKGRKAGTSTGWFWNCEN